MIRRRKKIMTKKIVVCMGSSCFCRGNEHNAEIIETYLQEHQLMAEVIIAGHRCHQLCNKGPVVSFDEQVFEQVDGEKLRSLLDEFFGTAKN